MSDFREHARNHLRTAAGTYIGPSLLARYDPPGEYRPKGGKHYGGHIERLIGTTMGSVHVLPGTTLSSPKDKGDYNSEQNATLTLAEFEVWLHLEICR